MLDKRLINITAFAVLCAAMLTSRQSVSAALGQAAERGDNCTPFNGYAVGFSIPPKGLIVSQNVVLANGWQTMGWLLNFPGGTQFFVPHDPFFRVTPNPRDDIAGNGIPPSFDYDGKLSGLYSLGRRYAETRSIDSLKNAEAAPKTILVAPCFTRKLLP